MLGAGGEQARRRGAPRSGLADDCLGRSRSAARCAAGRGGRLGGIPADGCNQQPGSLAADPWQPLVWEARPQCNRPPGSPSGGSQPRQRGPRQGSQTHSEWAPSPPPREGPHLGALGHIVRVRIAAEDVRRGAVRLEHVDAHLLWVLPLRWGGSTAQRQRRHGAGVGQRTQMGRPSSATRLGA